MRRVVLSLAALVAVTCTSVAPAQDEPVATDSSISLPDSDRITYPDGVELLLVPNDDVPIVNVSVVLWAGSLYDAPGKEGTARLLAELLRRGAGDRDAVAFSRAVEFVGGAFGTSATRRFVRIDAEFLTEDESLMWELIDDVLDRARLDADEFEKTRGLAIERLRAAREEPRAMLGPYFSAFHFHGDDAARPVGGDETSLAAVTLDDVKSAWRHLRERAVMNVVVSGKFDIAAVRERFDARPKRESGLEPRSPFLMPVGRDGGVLLVDKPDALQTYFRAGGKGVHWSRREYPARYLANTVLGGRFTSRLNTALRIESGLSYGAFSWFDDDVGGTFAMQSYTAVPTSEEALILMERTYKDFRENGLTQADLDSARNYVKGQYAPDNLETSEQAAGMMLALDLDYMKRDVIEGLFERFDALTLDDVNSVITEHFPAPPLTWVVIGPADELREIVQPLGEVTEVRLEDPGFGPR